MFQHFRESLPNAWGLHYDRAIDRRLWTLEGIGYSGIILVGNDNQLLNSRVAYSAANGVVAWGDNLRIENCEIRDANYLAGGFANIVAHGQGSVVRRSSVYNAGRELLRFDYLESGLIEYNHFYNGMIMTHDGGLIYTQ